MESIKKVFPSHFPKDCPPDDACEEQVIVHRLSNNDPPINQDFLSHVILNPRKKYNNNIAYGISVFKELEEIKHMLALNPLIRKKFKYICKGITLEGVIKETPSNDHKSHITWWLYEDSKPEGYFTTI